MKVEMAHCNVKEIFKEKEALLSCIIENMPSSLLQEIICDQENTDKSSSNNEL